MPTYPANAAGVKLIDGAIMSGDDAEAFRAAGFRVLPVFVQCSAKIAAGETPRSALFGEVYAAIDCNGASHATVRAIIGDDRYAEPATGIYNGEVHRSLLAILPAADVVDVHARLLAELPGFGCFAVLT